MSDFPKLGERIALRLVASTQAIPSLPVAANQLASSSIEDSLEFWMLAPFKATLFFSLSATAMLFAPVQMLAVSQPTSNARAILS